MAEDTKTMVATARVRLTVELGRLGSWGPECTVDQVRKQAAEAAINRIRQMAANGYRAEVIGKPVVTMVIAEDERV